jgi:hypothetical protein
MFVLGKRAGLKPAAFYAYGYHRTGSSSGMVCLTSADLRSRDSGINTIVLRNTGLSERKRIFPEDVYSLVYEDERASCDIA